MPTLLVAAQPDLGTSILIAASGLFVLFLSGMSWKLIGVAVLLVAAFIPVLWFFLMHDYQRDRHIVCVILLIAVDAFGHISKGAQRWLDLGFVRFQPSEIAKIAVPLMVARFINRDVCPPTLKNTGIALSIHIDPLFMLIILALLTYSAIVIWSASGQDPGMMERKLGQIAMGTVIMLVMAQVPPRVYESWAPYLAGGRDHHSGERRCRPGGGNRDAPDPRSHNAG
ncbi:hypothetical protein CRX72_11265 [Pantoea sp. BRM17]|nr:hypothetical protein CRX72_11265 [Pantoea sp. BRM17]